MGMFDTVVDDVGRREIQVKCFGKTLRKFKAGDVVVLYSWLDEADEQKILDEIDEQQLNHWDHPGYLDIYHGVISTLTSYQLGVQDSTYLTVVDGVLIATHAERDSSVVLVDRFGRQCTDGPPADGAWAWLTD